MKKEEKVYIEYKGVRFQVLIKEAKKSYGRLRYLVMPKAGEGELWTEKIIIKKCSAK